MSEKPGSLFWPMHVKDTGILNIGLYSTLQDLHLCIQESRHIHCISDRNAVNFRNAKRKFSVAFVLCIVRKRNS